jgi:hypothetical protein
VANLVGRRALINTQPSALEPQGDDVTFVWIMLAVLYITLLVSLGMATLRKGHTGLFVFGIIFPVLWIVGAVIEPTLRVAAAESRARLQ